MGAREWIMLVTLSVLWGGSFFFVGVAVSALPPLTIVALRVGLAAVTLWGVVLVLGIRVPRSLGLWSAFFVMGALNNVLPFSLIVWGQTQIGSGLASILNATTPLFTVVVAGLLLSDERISLAKVVGVVCGFVGTVVMIGTDALGGLSSTVLAQLAVLGAAISYAFAGVYGRRFKTMGVNPVVTAAGQVTASSLLLTPVCTLARTDHGYARGTRSRKPGPPSFRWRFSRRRWLMFSTSGFSPRPGRPTSFWSLSWYRCPPFSWGRCSLVSASNWFTIWEWA